MISNGKHKKHGDINRPALGRYGRNELAIYGTDCGTVEQMVKELRQHLSEMPVAYVDADHGASSSEFAGISYEWKGNSTNLILPASDNVYRRRSLLAEAALIVVNGNHFPASMQLLVVDEKKADSLRRRKDQIDCPVAVISASGVLPSWFSEIIPLAEELPLFDSIHAALADFIRSHVVKLPLLKALIMTGGKSVRMGRDKSLISYHGKEQFLHMKDMLESLGLETWISCRQEQMEYFEENSCKVIPDRILGIGPLGGILSAFMHEPDTAWLVVASDLPLIDKSVMEELIARRSPHHNATAFRSPYDQFPEPLIAIWEPSIYPFALQFIAQGISCPRKVLINTNSLVFDASQPDKLENVNTREEMEEVMESIKSSATKD